MLTSDSVILELFAKFPDFEKKMGYEPDDLLLYNVFGDFALDFRDDYMEGRLANHEIDEFFSFANEMAISKDIEVQNVLIVAIFEILSDERETVAIAREKLNAEGRQLLERTLRGWVEK